MKILLINIFLSAFPLKRILQRAQAAHRLYHQLESHLVPQPILQVCRRRQTLQIFQQLRHQLKVQLVLQQPPLPLILQVYRLAHHPQRFLRKAQAAVLLFHQLKAQLAIQHPPRRQARQL